jgi:tRNA(adenine34) deaminase
MMPRPNDLQRLHRRPLEDFRDTEFMAAALEQARVGQQTPGGAQVGCVLVEDGEIVCSSFNEGDLQYDPTAHAEMVGIRRLCGERKSTSLKGITVYCTLQPCGMCTMACLWAGVSRIVYGAGRDDVNSVYFESRHFDTADFIHKAFRDDLDVKGGVLLEECTAFYLKPDELAPGDPAHDVTSPPSVG